MEILLVLACLFARASGAQSEQAKLGLSPAQRDILKEQTRHDRAVQKIADKHAVPPAAVAHAPAAATGAAKGIPAAAAPGASTVRTVPDAFREGWRAHTPLERVATPVGRRAGDWAAQGVAWAKDTGRGALRQYRKRRTDRGHEDPAPVLVPLPPAHPPTVPPSPDTGPAVGAEDGRKGVSLSRPRPEPAADPDSPSPPGTGTDGSTGPGDAPRAPAAPTAPVAGAEAATGVPEPRSPLEDNVAQEPAAPDPGLPAPKTGAEAAPEASAGPDPGPAAATAPPVPEAPVSGTAGATPESEPGTEPVTDVPQGDTPPDPPVTEAAAAASPSGTATSTQPAAVGEGGVGRMAAEVTYESVMDESEELSSMCEEDSYVYDRIKARCEREISRGDALIASLNSTGFGQKVIGWVARCKDQYGAINGQLADLKNNTVAQGEAVLRARNLLVAGQGLYADIARDMDSVAEREAYLSDAVDSEDTAAHTEVYETRGA